MQKEFVFTPVSEELVRKHPSIHEALYAVFSVANECFSRQNIVRKGTEKLDAVVFNIGHSSRYDFHDCVFLALNGHGEGSLKLLRSFFEKAVTIAYLLKNPQLVNLFIKYYPINLHKVWKGAEFAGVKKEEWDSLVAVAEDMKVSSIEDSYKNAKQLFQQTDCETCQTTKQKISWDKDLASMVRCVGEPYQELYLPSYAIANLSAHTNIFNAYLPLADVDRIAAQQSHSKIAIAASLGLIIDVLKKQNDYFNLNITPKKFLECDHYYMTVRNELLGTVRISE